MTCSPIAFIVVRSRMAVFWMKREGVALGQPVLVHQQALGPVDQLAGLELLLEALALVVQRLHLLEAAEATSRAGISSLLLERLHQVGERAGVAGLLDQVALAEGGEDSTAARRSPAISRAAVRPSRPGHLDVEDGESGS